MLAKEEEKQLYVYHSYDEPKLIDLKLSVKLIGLEKHSIFETLQLFLEEIIESEYLGWTKTNVYLLDPKDFSWKSIKLVTFIAQGEL